MAMKIGFQTIVWGPRVRNLEHMLDVVAAAGFKGVEFFQRPEVLGNIERILQSLEKRHLELVGLAGGSLRERMDFCQEFRPEYLYVDTWNEQEACEAMDAGFTLGLHPHAHMPVGSLADALRILGEHRREEYPRLMFIADTAHLTVTHDDLVNAIRQTKDRLVAVHLKDWSPEFGRSSFRYARGFVELGKGRVDLSGVLKELRNLPYGGWVVAEQDYTLTDPDASTLAGAKWLAREGVLPDPPQKTMSRFGLPISKGRRTCPPEREVLFSRQIARARLRGINLWYDAIAMAFRKLIPSKLMEVWTSTPREDVMNLVAIKPDTLTSVETFIPNRHDFLSGITMERKAITHFDLTDTETIERFEHPELVERLNLTKMVSLPIFNPWNFNHIRLIVNIFPRDDTVTPDDDELFRFSANVAFALDAALQDICSASAMKVNFEVGRFKTVREFLGSLVELIRTTINCKGVAIFLVNDARDKLELAATTGTTWTAGEEERFYREGEGLTGWVWENGDTFLTLAAHSEPRCLRRSFEGAESDPGDDCLFVPLSKPDGEVIGVVRCRRKNASRIPDKFKQVILFSEDDAAMLESTAQAAVSHLEVLTAQERRARALGRLTHELKVPLVAIRGAVDFMRRTPEVRSFFDHDYLGDVWSWTDLMGRLIDNAEAFRHSIKDMHMEGGWTYLLKDVIAPTIKQVKLLLRERGFSPMRIHYAKESIKRFPTLWIDRHAFQQVVFNLLSNAIKYAYQDPNAFRVEIEGHETDLTLKFRDWGQGIKDGMQEVIFREGVRGDDAISMNVAGQGLGLWVVREILARHSARIHVTHLKFPTEFTIQLPYSIRSRYVI